MPTAPNVTTGDDKPRLVPRILYFKPSAIEPDEALDSRKKPVSAEKLARMVASLRAPRGQLQPIVVRQRKPSTQTTVIIGRTRHQAALIIEREDPEFRLLARVIECNDQEAFELALEENLLRNDLDPIDKAFSARRLLGYGWTHERVGEKFGVSGQSISQWVSVLTLPESIQDRIAAGSLRLNAALELVGKSDAEAEAIVCQAERDVLAEASAASASDTDVDAIPPDPGEIIGGFTLPRVMTPEEIAGGPPPADAVPMVVGTPSDGQECPKDATEATAVGDLTSDAPEAAPEGTGKAGRKPSNKAPKTPKLGKNGQPIVGARHVAKAIRDKGGVAKRTWSDLNTLLTSQRDVVSETILNYVAGLVEDGELRRVLNLAARDMEAAERREDEKITAGAKRGAGKGKVTAATTGAPA